MTATYTTEGRPEAEARVEQDLTCIVTEVRSLGEGMPLLGIVLLGGYARGEGTVVPGADGELRGFNDYDLLVVFERAPDDPEPWRELSRRLAGELEIDFVDLGIAGLDDLRRAAPILFWYELGAAHRWLWHRPGARVELPRFTQEELHPAEPSRLLINRGMAHLWGALRLWPHGTPGQGEPVRDPRVVQFTVIASHKAVLAAGDAALMGARVYSLHQEERRRRLAEEPERSAWAEEGFLEAYDTAVAFRRSPSFPPVEAVEELWWRARAHHEAGFRAAEELRLGRSLADWDRHAAIVRARAFKERWRHPRRALRSLVGGLRHGSWLDSEECLFTSMPALLRSTSGSSLRGLGPHSLAAAQRGSRAALAPLRRPMRQLIVLVDALGWITVERMGFLAERLPYRRRLTTVFGYSSTAIPSLLTGTWPREHGHWFLYRRARGRSPFVGAGLVARAPFGLGSRWRVRMRLQEFWRRRAKIRGYFSLYDVPLGILSQLEPVEKEDTWAPGSFPGTPSMVDLLCERPEAVHVSDWRVSDAEKIARARRALTEEKVKHVLLYLTEVDAVQHNVGTLHPEFEAKVREVEREVGALADLMAAEEPTGISLFSDHGMTDITGQHDLRAALRAQGLERGRDYDGFFDSTVARFWDIRDRGRLESVLKSLSWGRLLDAATIEAWGVDFPEQDYGEVFFLADPGLLIIPSDMGSAPLAAMHGYDPADPTSDACFLADREVSLESDHIMAVAPALRRRLEEGY